MNDTAAACEPGLLDVGFENPRPTHPVASTESPPPVDVLVIDTDGTHATAVKAMLQREGYNVVVTTRSVEAVELFRAAPERYGVVMTDSTPPGMSGVDIVRVLRAIRLDVPIIMLTSFGNQVEGDRRLISGIDAFLMKPLSRADLAATIAWLLTERARERPETKPDA